MSDTRLNGLAFDRGLVDVSHRRGDAAPGLPAQRQLDPAESLAAPQLEALLGARGYAADIEDALAPRLHDRALLLPGAFRDALQEARAALAQAARQPGADAARAKLLARAERALAEDLSLRDLLQMYRSVLYQG